MANALWGCHLGNYAAKHVIVVDEDIDIHDWEALEWALCYRVNAGLGDISFFSGTGGSLLDNFGRKARFSERRYADNYGVLQLQLYPGHYVWRFISVNGHIRDSGRDRCH